MTDFGAFIEIEEGIDGLVHVSDLSWTKRVKHPSEILKKGQLVQAVILNIDAKGHRLSLGIKQLQPDAWETYLQAHQIGDMVHGRMTRLAGFGAFVELAEGVEGLCHFSEVPGYSGRRAGGAAAGGGAGVRFQDHQDERGGKEDRVEPESGHAGRREGPPGGLPAPSGGGGCYHRRSAGHAKIAAGSRLQKSPDQEILR